MPEALPKLQRVAAYALILRDDRILLTRLASRISADEKWHLPGGGVDHGEDPRDALVREIREETGLDAEVGDTAHVYSAHLPVDVAPGPAVGLPGAAHRVRRVGAGRRARAAGGRGRRLHRRRRPGTRSPTCSSGALAGHRHRHRGAGRPPAVPAAADRRLRAGPPRRRRCCSPGSPRAAPTPAPGRCPGGGLDHGESPRDALAREVREECGVDVRGGRPARRPRHPLRRGGAVGPLRGLPRRPPGLPGHRPRRRRAARRRGRRHHRRGRLGAARRDRRRRASACSTSSAPRSRPTALP